MTIIAAVLIILCGQCAFYLLTLHALSEVVRELRNPPYPPDEEKP